MHVAGSIHADVVAGRPGWLGVPADVNDLLPRAVEPQRQQGRRGRADGRGSDGHRDRRPGRHAGVRGGRGRPARAGPGLRRRVRGRRRLLRGQGVPVHRGRPLGDQEGLGLDVCSGGELAVALRVGFLPSASPCTATTRRRRAARALRAGVGRIVVDSFDEIARVGYLAAELGVRPKIQIRVTTGVEAHTHEFIATAHEDQKFGLSLNSGAAAEAVRRILALPAARTRRPALPHRLADLRHRRLRGGRPPPRCACTPRSGRSTAWSCPSSTSAAASASPTPGRTTRPTSSELADELREIVARVPRRRASPCRGSPSSRGGRSPGRAVHDLRGRHRQEVVDGGLRGPTSASTAA